MIVSSTGSHDRWYAVQTQRGREAYVAEHLKRQQMRPFLPMVCKNVRHARAIQVVKAPLFPSYVFVSLNLERDRWRSINGTFGAIRVLSTRDAPLPLPCGLVERIQANVDSAGVFSEQAGMAPGQKVEFTHGPFSGLIGELQRLGADGRVRVLLTLMGCSTSVQTHAGALRIA